jgi:hypothetical protein
VAEQPVEVREPAPQDSVFPEAPAEPVGPTLAERMRQWFGGQELEALVGGSLLNKLGAVVLVVGIVLFLGYSFARMAPAGRALMALCIGGSMLGAGVALERSDRYKVFARGLIGAGWAALYATSYAIYAVPASRLIENPYAGSLVMVGVAVTMIAHSLGYRAQAVTAVAYFGAFVALGVTPSTPFAVMALVPLAASLLYLAWRFDWYQMSWFGMLATYLTCVSRGSSEAPLASTMTLFVAYWLLFEGFDLLRVRRRISGGGVESIFPLNAAGFLGLTYLAWQAKAPDELWLAAAIASGLYLASAVARALVRPPSSFAESESVGARLAAGGFEGALMVSAVLAGLAVVGRVPGVWMAFGLALEAEILYLAGVKFNSRFLRRFGGRAFVFSLGRILFVDVAAGAQSTVLGVSIHNWTPPVLFHVSAFYLNRVLAGRGQFFSYGAAALTAVVLGAELPARFIGTGWLLAAAVMFEIGLRKRLQEFRLQSYVLAVCGAAASVLLHAEGAGEHLWVPLAVSLALCYAIALRTRFLTDGVMDADERAWPSWGSAAASAILAVLLVWRTVPATYAGVAWGLLAVLLLESGFRRLTPEMRVFAYGVSLFAAGDVVLRHPIQHWPAAAVWTSWFTAALAGLLFVARLHFRAPAHVTEVERTAVRDGMAVYSAVFLLAGMWMVLPEPAVAMVWAVLALAWVEAGIAIGVPSFRWIGNTTLLLVAGQAVTQNLGYEQRFGVVSQRLLTVAPVIPAFYYLTRRAVEALWSRVHLWVGGGLVFLLLDAELGSVANVAGWALFSLVLLAAGVRAGVIDLRLQSYVVAVAAALSCLANVFFGDWLSRGMAVRWATVSLVVAAFYVAGFVARSLPQRIGWLFSLLATALTSLVLFCEVSGGLLTVAWGFQGLALLILGFPLRERILRLQGLALLLVCILKLFLYDLRNLETMHRILSFISLGLILLTVSWIYARFRERIKRYL